MKSKKLSKKLGLNKRTVAHLNISNMNNLKAGVHNTVGECETYETYCGTCDTCGTCDSCNTWCETCRCTDISRCDPCSTDTQ
jgi:hypothetical protein